jgi:hypothetical protein
LPLLPAGQWPAEARPLGWLARRGPLALPLAAAASKTGRPLNFPLRLENLTQGSALDCASTNSRACRLCFNLTPLKGAELGVNYVLRAGV